MEPVTIRLFGFFPAGSRDMTPYSGAFPGPSSIQLPGNKRLVVESIAALATAPNGQKPLIQLGGFDTTGKQSLFMAPIALQYQMSAKPRPGSDQPDVLLDWFAMDNALRLYVPYGGSLNLYGDRGPTFNHEGAVEVTISGYYEQLAVIKLPWPFPQLP